MNIFTAQELLDKNSLMSPRVESMIDYINKRLQSQVSLSSEFIIDFRDIGLDPKEIEQEEITYICNLYKIYGYYRSFSIWKTWKDKYVVAYSL